MSGHVLITGASSGIGREIARVAAVAGHDLVLTARRFERMEALAGEIRAHGVDVRVCACDLVDPAGPSDLHAWTEAEGVVVDVLVNNAGFGSFGLFWENDRERELDMIRLNVTALVDLTHRFLPAMVERGAGRILNVASMAAFQPGPIMSNYYATKAFVLHFTEGIACELSGTGVTATALCPGPVPTEFGDVVGVQARGFPPSVSAERVAAQGWKGMMKGKVIVVPGRIHPWLTRLAGLMPRKLVRGAVHRGQRKLASKPK